jgi:hypothetical protein
MSGDTDAPGRDEELRSLRERAKELKCVYDVVSALSRREEPPQAVFRRVLEAMLPAWQYLQLWLQGWSLCPLQTCQRTRALTNARTRKENALRNRPNLSTD